MATSLCTVKNTELHLITFNKLYKTSSGTIRAAAAYNNNSDPYRVRTPVMQLGANAEICGDKVYIDLAFCDAAFPKLVQDIDYLSIAEIYQNGTKWYPEQTTEPSLCQVEHDFVPTIKLSTISNDQQSLKLCAKLGNVEFFDGDGVAMPPLLLKAGYAATAILEFEGPYKEGSRIWNEWKLLQLKTKVPDIVLNQCQLVDVNDSSDEEPIIEDTDFY